MQIKRAMETRKEKASSVLESLLEAQKCVARRLEEKWLHAFTESDEFVARQRPAVSIGHVVDDVIVAQRRRKVHALQRV